MQRRIRCHLPHYDTGTAPKTYEIFAKMGREITESACSIAGHHATVEDDLALVSSPGKVCHSMPEVYHRWYGAIVLPVAL